MVLGDLRMNEAAASKARCLDVTRLISRLGRGPHTGVDRVELAYLRHLAHHPDPFFVLVKTVAGYVVLGQDGAQNILDRIEGRVPWGRSD